MKPSGVDLVFVLDTSESMRPCFDGLKRNINLVVKPLQGLSLEVRIGFVALGVACSTDGAPVFLFETLAGDYWATDLYGAAQGLFTTSTEHFSSGVARLSVAGDEHQLLALDCALDFSFGPPATTRRVIAMLSDEPVEGGVESGRDTNRIPEIVQKLMARKVQLFAALPMSTALEELAAADGAEVQHVDGGDGLATLDFSKLLGQMAKSISVSSIQGAEMPYTRALFGQNLWTKSNSVSTRGMR
jgi:hypothetical protein